MLYLFLCIKKCANFNESQLNILQCCKTHHHQKFWSVFQWLKLTIDTVSVLHSPWQLKGNKIINKLKRNLIKIKRSSSKPSSAFEQVTNPNEKAVDMKARCQTQVCHIWRKSVANAFMRKSNCCGLNCFIVFRRIVMF